MRPTSACSSWLRRPRNGQSREPSHSRGCGADAIAGKTKQGFANGFLGVMSFGRSTFATVAEATLLDLEEIERRLAEHFVSAHAAPGVEAALPAAREEAGFVVDLCRDAAVNTVFTVRRTWDGRRRTGGRSSEPFARRLEKRCTPRSGR